MSPLFLQSVVSNFEQNHFSGHFRAMQSSGSCQAVSGNHQTVVRQLSGSHQAVFRQSSGRCHAVVRLSSSVVRKLSVIHQAVVKQPSGSHQAIITHSSGSCQADIEFIMCKICFYINQPVVELKVFSVLWSQLWGTSQMWSC